MTETQRFTVGQRVRVLDGEDARYYGRVGQIGVVDEVLHNYHSGNTTCMVRFDTLDRMGYEGHIPGFTDPFYTDELESVDEETA